MSHKCDGPQKYAISQKSKHNKNRKNERMDKWTDIKRKKYIIPASTGLNSVSYFCLSQTQHSQRVLLGRTFNIKLKINIKQIKVEDSYMSRQNDMMIARFSKHLRDSEGCDTLNSQHTQACPAPNDLPAPCSGSSQIQVAPRALNKGH